MKNPVLNHVSEDYFMLLPDDIRKEIQIAAYNKGLEPIELLQEEFDRIIEEQKLKAS